MSDQINQEKYYNISFSLILARKKIRIFILRKCLSSFGDTHF